MVIRSTNQLCSETYNSYYVLRGAFGKFVDGTITSQCVHKMLSHDTFLENRIQRLLDSLIFVEKNGMHVQRMAEMSRVLYTGGNFKQNI